MRAPPTQVVITGMHRSGTSLVASLVGRLGVDLGPVIPPDAGNPRGYFEDRDFLALHRDMLAAATPEGPDGHRDWGFAPGGAFDREALGAFAPRARALVEERARAGRPWGFKDPRTSVLLDFWNSLLPEARYVLVYRPPWDVADAMQRLGAGVFLSHPEYAYEIWGWYNACLLDFRRRRPDRTLLVCADRIVEEPGRLALLLPEKLGLPVELRPLDDLVDPGRYRSRGPADPLVGLLQAASPDTVALLHDLDEAADLPSAGYRGASLPPARLLTDGAAVPSVTVVVPCYDHGEFLLEAVASAERHAPDDTELIIVDDGSRQPRTVEVLAVLRALGYRVEGVSHRGLAAARNHGFRCARARYVLPLDADNRLLPGFLEHARAILDSRPEVGVVYGDWLEFGGRSGPRPSGDLDLRQLLLGNFIDACAVIRRSAWEDAGGYDERLAAFEDWELWIALAERGVGFARVAPGPLEATFEYRVRPGSLNSIIEDEATYRLLVARIAARHSALYVEQLPALMDVALAANPAVAHLHRVLQAAAREARQAVERYTAEVAEARRSAERDRVAALEADRAARHFEAAAMRLAATVEEIRSSTSWRVSAPVRWLGGVARRIRHHP